MSNRDEQLDKAMEAMTSALTAIAQEDCTYEFDQEKDRPRPCPCPRCHARRALSTEATWRYVGASPERREGTSPTAIRENAIVTAWQKYMQGGAGRPTADYTFAQILRQAPEDRSWVRPTARDWFVATTIIQWLVTNVGQCVLAEAGYREKG